MTIQQMLLGASSGSSGLFDFSSFTFKTHLTYGSNSAGNYSPSDGYQGSLHSQLVSMSHYQNNGSSWYNDTNFFRMNTRGYQEWKVPATGNYKIKCMGAGGGFGGLGQSSMQNRGGYGSYVEQTVSLVEGHWLQIIVGHCGKAVHSDSNRGSGGGGGGSFVLKSSTGSFSTSNLILAGGGGGGGAHPPSPSWHNYGVGANGGLSTIQGVSAPVNSRPVGTYGGGAGYSSTVGNWGGGDGAGFLSNGYSSERESGSTSSTGMGRSYNNGMLGGDGESFQYAYGHNGGFGGGGAASWAAGGGGGYCGGPGDYSSGSGSDNGDSGPQGGGAGGLYYIGTADATGNNTIVDHGYVEVTKL